MTHASRGNQTSEDTEAALERPTDAEALRVVTAFFCIMEPEKRAELLALAERYAARDTNDKQ